MGLSKSDVSPFGIKSSKKWWQWGNNPGIWRHYAIGYGLPLGKTPAFAKAQLRGGLSSLNRPVDIHKGHPDH